MIINTSRLEWHGVSFSIDAYEVGGGREMHRGILCIPEARERFKLAELELPPYLCVCVCGEEVGHEYIDFTYNIGSRSYIRVFDFSACLDDCKLVIDILMKGKN